MEQQLCLRGSVAAAVVLGQLLHHLVDAEASRLLARCKVLEALQPLPHIGLGRHQEEQTVGPPTRIIDALVIGALERIAPQIEQFRQPELDKGLLPNLETMGTLLQKYDRIARARCPLADGRATTLTSGNALIASSKPCTRSCTDATSG